MRNNIVHSGAGELTYEIREIVSIAEKFEKLYNGEIVSKSASNEMLEILKKQELNDRIPK